MDLYDEELKATIILNGADSRKHNVYAIKFAVMQKQIDEKDKMIDLLIDYIDTLSEYYTRAEGKNNEFCDEKCIDKNIDCYDCIKQYFERKAEQKGE